MCAIINCDVEDEINILWNVNRGRDKKNVWTRILTIDNSQLTILLKNHESRSCAKACLRQKNQTRSRSDCGAVKD